MYCTPITLKWGWEHGGGGEANTAWHSDLISSTKMTEGATPSGPLRRAHPTALFAHEERLSGNGGRCGLSIC